MKHKPKIVAILLLMFLLTQFIGLYVVEYYNVKENKIPYGMETPKAQKESDYYAFLSGVLFAFVFAVVLLFLLTKFDLSMIIKIWFFLVITMALGISINAFFHSIAYSSLISLALAFVLAFFKFFRGSFIVHNLTELLVYPGIAAILVPFFNPFTIIVLLVLISIYDMWAVWHSRVMQKLAKYQIDKLKVFSGFFVPYLSKKQKDILKKAKKTGKDKKIQVNVAILGGGDVIFPIITSGVFLINFGILHAISVIAGAFFGLAGLFVFSEKKKFYPAMPFITAGMFLAGSICYFISFF